jgi:hypothetical protein
MHLVVKCSPAVAGDSPPDGAVVVDRSTAAYNYSITVTEVNTDSKQKQQLGPVITEM